MVGVAREGEGELGELKILYQIYAHCRRRRPLPFDYRGFAFPVKMELYFLKFL